MVCLHTDTLIFFYKFHSILKYYNNFVSTLLSNFYNTNFYINFKKYNHFSNIYIFYINNGTKIFKKAFFYICIY